MSNDRVEIEIELPEEMWDLLNKMAKKHNCSTDDLINEILSASLDVLEAKDSR